MTLAAHEDRVSNNELRDPSIELSVVIPCLNEADTVGACIVVALQSLQENGIDGEVILADNGSTDASREIAESLGVRIVNVAARGYGNTLIGGIDASRGTYILMGDADASYDFREIPDFVARLRAGYDLVQGCRLPSGGGRLMPGSMPFLHRWGNPAFSWLARTWFGVPIHDIHCGMRGFRREGYDRIRLKCTGMEFASEMVIKFMLHGLRITEVPITLRPDGRRTHRPHLRTFSDGWRHLRFFLLFSPRWLFLIPGVALILVGLLGYAIAMPATRIGNVGFDVHTLLFASLSIILGYQAMLFAVLAKTFAIGEGLMPMSGFMQAVLRCVTLERGLAFGFSMLLGGIVILLVAISQWRSRQFGSLDPRITMRWVIPGVTLTTVGFQTVLSSFFLSILVMERR